jgi:hypothetical protein
MIEDDLLGLLGSWALQATGVAEIQDDPGTEPAGTYLTLAVISVVPLGGEGVTDLSPMADAGAEEEQAEEIQTQTWEWRIILDVVAGDAIDRAMRLVSWSRAAVTGLALHPVAISRTSEVIRPEGTTGRARLDLFIHTQVREPVPADIVETVQVEFIDRHSGRAIGAAQVNKE